MRCCHFSPYVWRVWSCREQTQGPLRSKDLPHSFLVWVWKVGRYQGQATSGMPLLSHDPSFGLSASLCIFQRFSSDTWHPLQIPERAGLIDMADCHLSSGTGPLHKATSWIIHQPLWDTPASGPPLVQSVATSAQTTAYPCFSEQQTVVGKFTY